MRERFAKKYKCKVQLTTFNTMNEALSKLRSGLTFDVLVGATPDVLGQLVEGQLAQPLNHSYIPNISQAWPDYTNPFYDLGWQYTVPYTIYTTGITWRKDLVHENPYAMKNPWAMPWQPKYRGRVAILDDYREGICLGLMKNGIFDLNTTDYQQIALARQSLQDLSSLVNLRISQTDYSDVPGRRDLDHQRLVGRHGRRARPTCPRASTSTWSATGSRTDGRGPVNNDTMVVLKGASNPVLAHLFLNYLLDLPNALEQHLLERLHAAAQRGDPAGARQGADPAAVAHLDGGGAVELQDRACSSCSSRWTRTRSGSRPGSWSATGSREGRRCAGEKNAFWIALAAPGILWLAVLFIVPFYAVLAIAMGKLDQLIEAPVAVWNPLDWSSSGVIDVWRDIFGSSAFAGPILLRTIVYTAIASLLCLLIGYPAAYFVARFAGRRKALFLVLLIAPFWISYMMRMLAWIDLLSTGGYVNKALGWVGISPVNWLGGNSATVVLGLVYGYIPYLIMVLYAGLDRIDPALLEAGRDLGLGRSRTFVHVTLPLSRQPILTGLLITVLPMLGDYYTNQMLSGAASTSMIGNLIQGQLGTPGLEGQGAVLSLMLLLVLLIPMIYYVIATNREAPR